MMTEREIINRIAEIFDQYEELQLSTALDADRHAKLAELNKDFKVLKDLWKGKTEIWKRK